ncbi:MAG: 2-hydroxyacid dehydrogenase [Candidatus Heimdallarchaeota archaeon]
MKVLYMMRKPEEKGLAIAHEVIDDSATLIFNDDLQEEEKEEILAEVDIIIGGRLTDEQLKIANNLKMQQSFGTGVERHNLEYFKEKGIIFCNNHSHAFVIAEYGFSLLNAASKELLSNDQLLRKGSWDYKKHESISLYDKTMVFLGYGEIAKSFKRLCEPFNMKFLAVKRTEECEDPSVNVFLADQKKEALKKADFIFNSLPLTKKTTSFLDEEEFKIMKENTIVINVGRGKTINERALYNALKEKKIKGAAIDTWYVYPENRFGEDQEPDICFPSDYPFQELDNIIMSAHRAWVTDIPLFESPENLIQNVNRFIRGEIPENVVNFDEEY